MTTEELMEYARENRRRTRNLHDGHPLLPLRPKGPVGQPAYRGVEDRWDAIIGGYGYLAVGGGQLIVFLAFKSAKGVRRSVEQLLALGGITTQLGDSEISAVVPDDQIDEAAGLIRAYRLRPGNVANLRSMAKASPPVDGLRQPKESGTGPPKNSGPKQMLMGDWAA